MTDIIGIDASRAVRVQRSGTENYSVQIIEALRKVAPNAHLRLYYPATGVPACLPPTDDRTEHVIIPGERLWTHLHLASELHRQPPDVLFVPAHVIPIKHPRSVVTIHDLGYLHYPGDHPVRQRAMLSLTTRWNVHHARQIIVPSQFTADDLKRRFPGTSHKITVVLHGASSHFRPAASGSITRIKSSIGIQGDYVVAVGTIQPRKDYPTLARAVARHNVTHSSDPLFLVIVGRPGWMFKQVMSELEPLRQRARLRILTDASDHDLVSLYSGATALVQPSRFEGFGMPVLEAMACGAPVICANNSSLPEVVGEAGLLFPTGDVAALATLLGTIRTDRELQASLSAMGARRASQSCWETAAEKTLGAIELAMEIY